MMPYADLRFPPPHPDRPYTFINMVATIDGKTVSGGRDEHVMDLGSEVDHAAMRALEEAADAVIIGAGSLRATKGLRYPERLLRVVVTTSGMFDAGARFFTDAPDRAIVACPVGARPRVPSGVRVLQTGIRSVDLRDLTARLRREFGVNRLLVEGGSELNAAMLSEDLVDELFLTLAPKVKLGRDVPTYAGGEPLPRERIQSYELISHERIGDELFLRYRRKRY